MISRTSGSAATPLRRSASRARSLAQGRRRRAGDEGDHPSLACPFLQAARQGLGDLRRSALVQRKRDRPGSKRARRTSCSSARKLDVALAARERDHVLECGRAAAHPMARSLKRPAQRRGRRTARAGRKQRRRDRAIANRAGRTAAPLRAVLGAALGDPLGILRELAQRILRARQIGGISEADDRHLGLKPAAAGNP